MAKPPYYEINAIIQYNYLKKTASSNGAKEKVCMESILVVRGQRLGYTLTLLNHR
jgi:hypothetical protein